MTTSHPLGRKIVAATVACLLGVGMFSAMETPEADAVIGGSDATNPGSVVGIFISASYSRGLLFSPGLYGASPRDRLFCTGTLVAPDIVVTAGHCTQNPFVEGFPYLTLDQIRIGAIGDSTVPSTAPLTVGELNSQTSGEMTPATIVQHPHFSPTAAIDRVVDLAVIQLPSVVPGAVTVGLESNPARPAFGTQMDFYGWGRVAAGGARPTTLQYGLFTHVDTTNCLTGVADDLCVGGDVSGATPRVCTGDSGGGVVASGKLQAVASYAPATRTGLPNCGAADRLDGAQPVAEHLAWFTAVTATRPIQQASGVPGTTRVPTTPTTTSTTMLPTTTTTQRTQPVLPTVPPDRADGPCPSGGTPFTDISSSFAANDIACIYQLGVTTGTSATSYSPTDLVTREQMAAFIGRLIANCPTAPHGFVDVAASSFASAFISCIKGAGITTGTSPTTYSPNDPVTREQMAAFIARFWRAVGNPCPGAAMPFRDVSPTSFARADIACLFNLGITTGTSATAYSPQDPVTREQMAAFLARFLRANAAR